MGSTSIISPILKQMSLEMEISIHMAGTEVQRGDTTRHPRPHLDQSQVTVLGTFLLRNLKRKWRI